MNLILLGGFSEWFWETINFLFLWLCNFIYSVIAILYKVFQAIAKTNLFSEKVFDEFVGRIYIVVGIAMLFIFAYNLILMIIDPNDKKSTGQMTKVVKETIISLILVILLPTIFNWMYIFQNNVIESNIIGKIMLGGIEKDCTDPNNKKHYDCGCDNFLKYEGLKEFRYERTWFFGLFRWFDGTTDQREALKNLCEDYQDLDDATKGAYSIPPILIRSFYRLKAFSFEDCETAIINNDFSAIDLTWSEFVDGEEGSLKGKEICINYYFDFVASKFSGEISPFVWDDKLMSWLVDNDGALEFNGIMALAAGIIALLMFASYCIDVGARVAKLGLLQILSPIAVMMRIIPKQKEAIYDKWFKQLMDTYLDVFIRLFIIFFTLFVISLIPEVVDTLFRSFSGSSDSFWIKTLVLVFLILGLLRFAQEAPGLIKDFFGGGSGKFGINPLKKISENKYAMGGIGAIGGMAKTGIGNFIRGRNAAQAQGKYGARATLAGLKRGVGGATAGVFRGYKEGYKTKNFSDMGTAIDRAKAKNDENYFKRDIAKTSRDRFGDEFVDKLSEKDSVLTGGKKRTALTRRIASSVGGRYQALRRSGKAVKSEVLSWGGTKAIDDAKRNANNSVKGYSSTVMEAIDSQTKGMIKQYENQRDERIRNANPEDIDRIKKEYSTLIDSVRYDAAERVLKGSDPSSFEPLKASIQNLCDALKDNQAYLEHFDGDGGTLQSSIKDFAAEMTPEFRKNFEGSLDNFASGINDYLSNSSKLSSLNEADIRGLVGTVDKLGKTAGSNLRGLSNKDKSK